MSADFPNRASDRREELPSAPSGLEQLERREGELWRMALLFLSLLGTALAVTFWEKLRDLPHRWEGVSGGVLVLVILFAVYASKKRREIKELRAFVRGMQHHAEAPPSEKQLDRLVEIISRSQQGYRELIDSLEDPVFSLSLEGEIRAANRRFADLVDEPFPGVIGRRLDELADLADGGGRAAALKALPRFLAQRHWEGNVRVQLKKTAATRYFDCVLRAIVKDGEVTGISGLARDVTQLHESEARFTHLFETLQEGIYFSTPDGQLLDVNPALVHMLGYSSKKELLGISVEDLYFDPATRPNLLRELEQNATVRDREINLRHKGGRRVICLDTSTAIRDSAGKIIRFQGTLVDITQRREMEKRLHEEQEFARRLVASFPDLVVALDAEGRYTFVSPNIRDLLGYAPEDLIGRKLGERTPDEDSKMLQEFFLSLVSGRVTHGSIEYKTLHQDGSLRTFRAAGGPLYDATGKITGVVASSRDITDQRRLQQQVMQSEKLAAMGQLIAGVAHELNNPLTAILGVSELLGEKAAGEQERHQLDLVHQQARRAASIVQDLLVFSRPPAPGRSTIHLNELVQRTVRLQESAMRENNVSLDLLPGLSLPPVSADANQLIQVFVNLLRNAEQAIREVRDRGTIRIRLGSADGQVWVSFQDDGPGIKPEVLPKIFDPFFTTKRPGMGTGLGLSICLALLKQYDGNIEVQNAPGGGSVFTVWLPASAQAAEPPRVAPAAVPPPELEGRRILVIEDEEGIRELVMAGLAARGVAVECVATGEEALQQLNSLCWEDHFDAILCDMKMPGISGPDVLHALRNNQGTLWQPFIFMTGDLLMPEAMESLRGLGVRVIQKLFRIADLTAIVSEELARFANE